MTTYMRSQAEHRQAHTSDQRSLGELFADLSQKASLLARQEVQLAKIEMKQKATAASSEITTIVVGGFLANVALLTFAAALIFGLAYFVAFWLAAFIVSVLFALAAALFIGKGVAGLRAMSPIPEQTMTTLREDKEWLTRQMNQ